MAALKNALAPVCNCKRNGEWKRLAARELVPGDIIMLKIGDVVPADGILQADTGGKATCDLDQSGLTGESLPVKKVPGDTCYSGTVVKRGEQDMLVTHIGEKTEMGKGVALIQSVDSKGQVEVRDPRPPPNTHTHNCHCARARGGGGVPVGRLCSSPR